MFDQNKISAAHRTLPMPSVVKVTNLENGLVLEKVRINDRGPFARNRIIDLYSPKIGELLFGIVSRVDKNNVFLDLSSNESGTASDEAMILKDNLIPREIIKPGDRIRGYLMDVQSESRLPQLYISRKCSEFLIELFRL